MTDYGYVIVHHTTDPAQGEMIAELLRNEGIAARFRGAASTLIGLTKDLAPMAVEVPIGEEDRAREFLRDLEDTAIVADSGGQAAPGRPEAPAPRAASGCAGARRNLAISVVATLVLLGADHHPLQSAVSGSKRAARRRPAGRRRRRGE